jgi:hypothetical protein
VFGPTYTPPFGVVARTPKIHASDSGVLTHDTFDIGGQHDIVFFVLTDNFGCDFVAFVALLD